MKSNNREIKTLTNDLSKSTLGKTIPCYTREFNEVSDEYIQSLKETTVFYWTSFFQYENFIKLCPEIKDAFHCCGLGKTYTHFSENNIRVKPFSTMKEFNLWIKK